jgi:hypothetical protein
MKSDFLRTLMIGVYLLGTQTVNADPLPRDEQPKRPPVLVKLCSAVRGPEKPGQTECPGPVQRTLLIPFFVNPRPSPIELWKVTMFIFLTEEGLKFNPQVPPLKWSEFYTDTVWLQPGWPGLYVSDLERFMHSVAHSDPDHKYTFAWDDESDPDFRIYSALGNTQKNGYPKRLLVPKSGEEIFFECFSPVVTDGRRVDPLCPVRDYTDSQHDGLEYHLKESRLKDWRRYSKWLWDYVDSITVREAK